MKNIKKATALLLFLVCASLNTANGQTTIVDTSQLPPELRAGTDFQGWYNIYSTIQRQISLGPNIPVLKIIGTTAGINGFSYPDTIAISIGSRPPADAHDYSDIIYSGVVAHEYTHLFPNGTYINNSLVGEGYAEGASTSANLLGYMLRPDLFKTARSNVMMVDLLRNTNPRSWITWRDKGYIQYGVAGGIFEILCGGDCIRFGALMTPLATLDGVANKTLEQFWQEYLQVADQAFDDIDGQSPSRYLQRSPLAGYPSPDGIYLNTSIYWYSVKDGQGNEVMQSINPVIHEPTTVQRTILEKVNGIGQWRYDGLNKNMVTDTEGNVKTAYTSTYDDPGPGVDTAGWPDGTYQLHDCWIPPGSNDCTANPDLTAVNYFPVLRNVPEYWKDHVFIFANGGPDYKYDQFKDTRPLHLVKRPGDTAEEEASLPGMLVVKLHGQRTDIVVSDGVRSKTYSVAYRNPIYPYTISRFIPWTEYDERLFAIANNGNWANERVVRGYIYALFGRGLAPTLLVPTTLPLPTSLDGVQVIFRAGGTDYLAPLFYAYDGQINIQVPWEIPEDVAEANVQIITTDASGNQVISNPIRVEIVRNDPEAFYADFNTKLPAIIQDGQLVTAANPARNGKAVSLYANSLGPVTPAIESGHTTLDPNNPRPLSVLTDSVSVTIGGQQAEVLWAGLAPSYVGLGQINVRVPMDLPAGLWPVIITVNGVSNQTPILLPTAP